MSARRLPPYGRELAQARAGDLRRWWGTSPDGLIPTITVLCGRDAWNVKREWPDRLMLVCPHRVDPGVLDWSLCAGADPVLLWRCGPTDGDQVRRLITALMRDGVDRVLDAVTLDRYLVEVSHAA